MTPAGRTTSEVSALPEVPETGRRVLRPDRLTWPIWTFTAGVLVSYLFGVHGVVWVLPGLVFGIRLLRSPRVTIPFSAVPLILFLGWALLSLSVIPPSGYPLFFYRWLLFAGCLTSFLWLVNVSPARVSSARIVDLLAAMWICVVLLGYAAIVFKDLTVPSPFMRLLGPVGRVEFVASISQWRFAETQGFLGYALHRPAAPFGAANGWGAAMALLMPYFVRSWLIAADARRRARGVMLLFLAAYPIVVSVNRGLWMSLAVALIYFAARKALRGQFAPLMVLLTALAAVAVLLVVTPAGSLVSDRLSSEGTERSNQTRANLYELAYDGARQAPLIGNGAPVRSPDLPESAPPVGSHGMLWYQMFVHGFVGSALFVTWMAVELLRSGAVRTPLGWWTHLSIVISLVMFPYYGLLPQVVLVGISVGLSHREERF